MTNFRPEALLPTRKMLGILLLLLASYVFGRLGLFLAIPPGYATAVWPPAGIALAGVLHLGPWGALGVFLGSFLLNVGVGGALPTPTAVMIAASIALGSTLQALLGAFLIRRALGDPLALDREREVLRFLVLGGPVACLVACIWGTGTLLLLGTLPLEKAFLTLGTWWAGDVLGVLVFAPLGLIWVGQPKDLWHRRRIALGVPLVASLTLMTFFFLMVRQRETNRIRSLFVDRAQAVENSLQVGLGSYLNHLEAMASFFEASSNVDPAEFEKFTRRILAKSPGILALEWAPSVASSHRQAFEKEASALLGRVYEIKEIDARGALVRARELNVHFPVLYALPEAGNQRAVGFDLASESDRKRALDRALAGKMPIASPAIGLVQDGPKREAVIVADPTFRPNGAHQGYVLAVFRVEEMLADLLRAEALASNGMILHFHEEDREPPSMGTSLEASKGEWISRPKEGLSPSLLTWSKTITFAGQKWKFTALQDPVLVGGPFNWESWAVLAAGVLFTGLLGAMLLIITGRTRVIEGQVEARTQELQESEANLMRQSRLLSQTQIAAKVGGWELDLEHGDLFWTPETFHLHGLDPAAFHPTIAEASTFILPTWVPMFTAALERAIRNGEPMDLEVELQPSGGSSIWVQVTGRTEKGHGASPKLYGAYQDVTQRKQAEQLKNEFISVVSHELRTPLTALKGAITLLVEGEDRLVPDQRLELQRIARANADRLNILVNDLLDMEKIRTGKLAIDPSSFTLLPLVDLLLRDTESLGQSRGIQFNLQAEGALPEMLADPKRVTQVLTNLISNAVKFSPDGGRIHVALETREAFIRLAVTDQGPGIPQAFRERVFQPFSQADASDRRAIGGTGLGLSICKALVERMGGSIGFTSEPGKGSTFWFELPVAS